MTEAFSGFKKILLRLCVTDAFFILIFIGFGQMILPHGVLRRGFCVVTNAFVPCRKKRFRGMFLKTFLLSGKKRGTSLLKKAGADTDFGSEKSIFPPAPTVLYGTGLLFRFYGIAAFRPKN